MAFIDAIVVTNPLLHIHDLLATKSSKQKSCDIEISHTVAKYQVHETLVLYFSTYIAHA